jgi:hypothetical protein
VALRRRLRREVAAWREKYRRMEREGLYEADPDWVREDLAEFLRENRHLVEKILPHRDLVDEFADAVEEETYGYLTRRDVLEILKPALSRPGGRQYLRRSATRLQGCARTPQAGPLRQIDISQPA